MLNLKSSAKPSKMQFGRLPSLATKASLLKDNTKNNQGENGAPLKSYLAVLAGLQVRVVQYHDLQINDKAYIYLSELAVDPDYQGKGVGQQLIKKVLDDATKAKLPCLLITRAFNENAKALYIKLGFQQVSGEEAGKLVSGCGYNPNNYIALRYSPSLSNQKL